MDYVMMMICFILSTCFLMVHSMEHKSFKITSGKDNVTVPEVGISNPTEYRWKFVLPDNENRYLVLNINTNSSSDCGSYILNERGDDWAELSPCVTFTITSSDACHTAKQTEIKGCLKSNKSLNKFTVALSRTGIYNPRSDKYSYPDCFQMKYEFIDCKKASDGTTSPSTVGSGLLSTPRLSSTTPTTPTTTTEPTTTISPKPITTTTTTPKILTTPITTTKTSPTTNTTTGQTTDTTELSLTTRPWFIIVLSTSVALLVIVAIIVVAVCCYRKNKQARILTTRPDVTYDATRVQSPIDEVLYESIVEEQNEQTDNDGYIVPM